MLGVTLKIRTLLLCSLCVVVSACLPTKDTTQSSTAPASPAPVMASCNPSSYDVTLQARDQFKWPFDNGCNKDDFYKWYQEHQSKNWLGHTIYFDGLDKTALPKVHLEHETLSIQAIVFDLDDINYKHIKLSMNGFKSSALNSGAVTVNVLKSYKVPGLKMSEQDLDESDDSQPVIKHGHGSDGHGQDGHGQDGKGLDGNDDHDGSRGWQFGNYKDIDWDRFLDYFESAWEDRQEHGKDKGSHFVDIHSVSLVQIDFHLENYVFGINQSAADLLRASSLTDGTARIKITHLKGFFRSSSGQLHLQGEFPGDCPSPTPTPTPAASPTPSPTPLPPPPTATINSTSVGILTNVPSIQITFSANVSATFQCSLDASAYSACASPYSQSGLADGTHNFSVRGVDSFGQVGQPAQFQWTVDTTAPVVTFGTITPADSETSSTSIAFNFSANEQSTFQCALDASAAAACNSPVSFSGLTDGTHTFTVTPTDMASNVGQSISYTWTVKTLPPTLSFTQIIPANSPSNSTSRTFYFTASSDAVSFTCALDAQAAAACTSPYQVTGLTDGSHTVSVWAFDSVGNQSAPATSSFTTDTIPPTTIITSTVPNQSPTNNTTMQISFSANESANFECSLDGAAAAACTSPVSYTGLAEGSHVFQVVATDDAGNVDPTGATYKWTVDTTAPVLTLVSENPNGEETNQTQITLTYTVNETATIACSLDGAPSVDCSSGTVTFTGLTDGSHRVSSVATDLAGNTGSTINYGWTVDTTAPVVTIASETPATSPTNSTSMSISFSASEVATFQCQLDGAPFSACTSPQSYSGLTNGTHTFAVEGTDGAGNVSASAATYTWTVDTVAPTTQITSETPNVSPTNSSTISFSFSASEASTFSCSLDGGGATACSSPQTYNGLADGSHTFKVVATDLAGNVDPKGASYTWTVNTQPLTITNFAVTNITTNSALVTWTTNLPSTSQVSYALYPSTTYVSTPLNSTPTTTHSVQLSGLTSNGFYSVYGVSVYGTERTQSAVVNFRTLR